LSSRAIPTKIKEMSKIISTGAAAGAAASAYVEEDLITSIWTVIVSSRAELLMFVAAMVGYAVLCMQRTPKNPKLQSKKVKGFEQDDYSTNATLKSNSNSTKAPRKSSSPRDTPTAQSSSSPDIAKQINMIRTYGAERNLQGAFSVFESMEQSGIDLNCIMYNTVLHACVECKDLKAAETWMERMKKADMADVVSFNTLIKAHLQSGSFDKARRLMEVMTSDGLKPNQVTFNELINAMVSRGGDSRRKQLWRLVCVSGSQICWSLN